MITDTDCEQEDKFESITDDELEQEVLKRGLEDEFTVGMQGEIDELEFEISKMEHDHVSVEGIQADIQILCDSFQYSDPDAYLRNVKAFLVSHGGLIA